MCCTPLKICKETDKKLKTTVCDNLLLEPIKCKDLSKVLDWFYVTLAVCNSIIILTCYEFLNLLAEWICDQKPHFVLVRMIPQSV